jgi:hypothetical protein
VAVSVVGDVVVVAVVVVVGAGAGGGRVDVPVIVKLVLRAEVSEPLAAASV